MKQEKERRIKTVKHHLYLESKEETEDRMVVARGWGVREKWKYWSMAPTFSYKINSGDLKYSMWLWRRQWHPTPVLLPGKSHGWRSLVGCSPWGCKESDTTEQLHFHFSLSCIREGNGNPLQCSCLENPRDGGAWWATVYGVAQSRTRLKWFSSSSSSVYMLIPRCWFIYPISLW